MRCAVVWGGGLYQVSPLSLLLFAVVRDRLTKLKEESLWTKMFVDNIVERS